MFRTEYSRLWQKTVLNNLRVHVQNKDVIYAENAKSELDISFRVSSKLSPELINNRCNVAERIV